MTKVPTFSTLTIEEATECLIDYRGRTPPKTNSGVRLVTAKVVKGGQINDEPAEFIAPDFYVEWMRRGLPQKLDVLLTTEAPLGEVAILRDDARIALAQRIILLRAKRGMLDPLYLFYALQSDFSQGELKARATGTTVLGIKQSELRKVHVPVFPLAAQQRIAGILSAYDELIDNSQRRIKILDAMALALYRRQFVYAQEAPNWPKKTLGDFITLKRGYDLPDRLRRPGSVQIVSSSGVTGSHDESKVTGPGLVTGRYGTLGEVHLIWEDFWPLNTSLYVVNFHNTPLLYAYWLLKDVLRGQSGSAAAVPGLNRNHLHQLACPAPPHEIQQSFHSAVAPMAAQTRALQRQIQNLRRSRDLLLPRLFSGQINVEAA